MKIAFLTPFDARDVNKWSGTSTYMAKHLELLVDRLVYTGPLIKRYSFKHKILRAYYKKIMRKNYLMRREPEITASYAKQAKKMLDETDVDVILTPWTLAIAEIETDKPIVLWSDACFASLVDFYKQFSNVCSRSLEYGHRLERKALDRCDCIVYSSEWAAEGAIRHYGLDPKKIKVIPFGANIECNRTLSDIEQIIDNKSTQVCKLLFFGKDWERKGGKISLLVAEALNARGVATELTIVGCEPKVKYGLPDFVKVLGFIDKSSSAGYLLINQLLQDSHFMILPSIAEAYGVVFCEASSFGLPSIALNLGGIPVRNNVNGLLFDIETSIEEYCQCIENLLNDREIYNKLAQSSFIEYEHNLNWTVAAQRVVKLLKNCISIR